ncbi:predicted protein [Botrytis cinerea T4]|uniref:Uncharacterized protein n=1 Tax=Botryotinia fuckeliana (strain T4) TaxID=999810 RepID=G2YEL5_BOTF4|nr:predicted protein [Botrytis cinerea T4]
MHLINSFHFKVQHEHRAADARSLLVLSFLEPLPWQPLPAGVPYDEALKVACDEAAKVSYDEPGKLSDDETAKVAYEEAENMVYNEPTKIVNEKAVHVSVLQETTVLALSEKCNVRKE